MEAILSILIVLLAVAFFTAPVFATSKRTSFMLAVPPILANLWLWHGYAFNLLTPEVYYDISVGWAIELNSIASALTVSSIFISRVLSKRPDYQRSFLTNPTLAMLALMCAGFLSIPIEGAAGALTKDRATNASCQQHWAVSRPNYSETCGT